MLNPEEEPRKQELSEKHNFSELSLPNGLDAFLDDCIQRREAEIRKLDPVVVAQAQNRGLQ